MLKKAISKDREPSRFSDLIGVDFSTTATKVVRLKESKGALTLTGLELLPPVDFSAEPERLRLPRNMTTNYSCLVYTGGRAIVRMINTHVTEEEHELETDRIRKHLNVTADYRVSASLVKRGTGRQDSSFLAAAIPEEDASRMLGMFPAGPPAPASLEVAGLSFITAFLQARGSECSDSSVCLLECGELVSNFVFLTDGIPALVGKLPFGAKMMRESVAAELGLDAELASSILRDESVDISSTVASALSAPMKQLSISKDFIERHLGHRISKLYISGGMSLLPGWMNELGRLLGVQVETWSPLGNIQYDSGTVPEEMISQVTRFTAAIGAAVGGLESA